MQENLSFAERRKLFESKTESVEKKKPPPKPKPAHLRASSVSGASSDSSESLVGESRILPRDQPKEQSSIIVSDNFTRQPRSEVSIERAERTLSPSTNQDIERQKVIDEIYSTEKSYYSDLLTLESIYFTPSISIFDKDHKIIFGNLKSVIHTSKKLLDALRHMSLGESFIEISGDFKIVFTEYCKGCDHGLNKLESLSKDVKIKDFLAKQNLLLKASGSSAWDLPSLLIKPVQRVLKYSLLLSQALKYTPESDLDHENVKTALEKLQDVADYINSTKRRRGINKKLSRGAQSFKNATEGRPDDAEFNKLRTIFEQDKAKIANFSTLVGGFHEKILNVAAAHALISTSFTAVLETNHDASAQYDSNVQRLAPRLNLISQMVSSRILEPLSNLDICFTKASKVIKKRDQKFLDYSRYQDLKKSESVIDKSLVESSLEYEALNTQLVQELDTFRGFVRDLLDVLFANFADILNQANQVFISTCKIEFSQEFGVADTSELSILKKWRGDSSPLLHPPISRNSSFSRSRSVTGAKGLYVALYDFVAQEPDEIDIREGDLLELLMDDRVDWVLVLVQETGLSGYVPRSYVESK